MRNWTPVKNVGNLFQFRIESGDDVLKTHFNTCNLNSSYTRLHIQNEIINTRGQTILTELVNKINESGSFSMLADETRYKRH